MNQGRSERKIIRGDENSVYGAKSAEHFSARHLGIVRMLYYTLISVIQYCLIKRIRVLESMQYT